MKLETGLKVALAGALLLGGVGTCHQYRAAAKTEARAEQKDALAEKATARADSLGALARTRLDSIRRVRTRMDSIAADARIQVRVLTTAVDVQTDSVAAALPDSARHLIASLRAAQADLAREHERETTALRDALASADSRAELWETRFRAERAARRALEHARDEWREAANPGLLASFTREAPRVALYAGAGFVACAVLC